MTYTAAAAGTFRCTTGQAASLELTVGSLADLREAIDRMVTSPLFGSGTMARSIERAEDAVLRVEGHITEAPETLRAVVEDTLRRVDDAITAFRRGDRSDMIAVKTDLLATHDFIRVKAFIATCSG